MRLLALEIKRVLKTKRTWILIVASVLLAVFMAYIPITFVTVQKTDESGNYVEITGKDAINYYKSNMVQGVVKPEILRDAVRRYQEVYKTYDSVYGDNIPSEVYYEKLSAYQPYIRGIKEALADRNNGMSPVIADISIDKVGEYYDLLESRLASVIVWSKPVIRLQKRLHSPNLQKYSGHTSITMALRATPWNMRRFSFS